MLLIVALLNLAYFGVEFAVAVSIGSVSLFADSVDFLEDTAINLLIFFAVLWPASRRRTVGSLLAIIILVPGVAALWTAVAKMLNPVPPEPSTLTVTAVGALVVNLACAALLLSLRGGSGSLVKAAWLAARNDALANLLMIATGLATLWVRTAWFDIVVGLVIAAVNVGAAREVWKEARAEGELTEDEMIDEALE
ncbi:cation transporter [Nigerium massiliense]|uniref:cation transporter n=1 Tax=Nigerium massiliense TaxID=1522317 RepID=UPI000694D553|nr:cation transporter [Nigerium massiliense]